MIPNEVNIKGVNLIYSTENGQEEIDYSDIINYLKSSMDKYKLNYLYFIIDDFQDFMDKLNTQSEVSLNWIIKFLRDIKNERINIRFILINSIDNFIKEKGKYFSKMIKIYNDSNDVFGNKQFSFEKLNQDEILDLIDYRCKKSNFKLSVEERSFIDFLISWLNNDLNMVIKSLKRSCNRNDQIRIDKIIEIGYENRLKNGLWLDPLQIKNMQSKIDSKVFEKLNLEPFGSQSSDSKITQDKYKKANIILVLVYPPILTPTT
ncbi:MAG: hypothetical protein INQ03_26080 [Candidatus Heimdallarchaeota archaeon]|nr:hypothetical protein [Candidatus Heimdallarchaeota archaeon]